MQVEFEQRLTSVLLLQQNFVAKETGAAPSSYSALQARYEDAPRVMLARLKSDANINTRISAL